MTIAAVRVFSPERFDDERGSLVVMRHGPHLPFAVQEAYFIFSTSPPRPRGGQAYVALE